MSHRPINKGLAIACLLSIFISTLIASAHRRDFTVTEARLAAEDTRMTGPCPINVVFNGYITTDGPGTVRYAFVRSDGATGPTREMVFNAAGTRDVSTSWTVGNLTSMPHFEGWQAIRILSPNTLESRRANFTLDCSRPSVPVSPLHGRFRITFNGFRVNHQTNQGLWAAWDAVRFVPEVQMVNAAGDLSLARRTITTTIGSTPENAVQGGDASTRGGLRTGNDFPTLNPWRRIAPINTEWGPRAIPPTIYFENEIIQNTNAAFIIATIWEVDGRDDLALRADYHAQLDHDLAGLGRAVARIIRGPQPLTLDSYLRAGSSVGLNIALRLAVGVPQDRPIGMQPERDQFGFIPQVLVLTFDSAEFISRTGFGFGVGVVPIRYVDPPAFAGDYTLFLQVERLS